MRCPHQRARGILRRLTHPRFSPREPAPLFISLLVELVDACRRAALPVLLASAAVCVALGTYTTRNLGMDTDTDKLFPEDLPWQQTEAAFDAAFPQNAGLLAVVIDATTPEQADAAASLLATRLERDPSLFRDVRRPDGGDFFKRHGLLYLDDDELAAIVRSIADTQPLLGQLAREPTLRGLFELLGRAIAGAADGELTWDRLREPLSAIAGTTESVLAGSPVPMSWQSLVSGRMPGADELRRFLLVNPVLDYSSLTPGARASDAIRALARDLALTPEHGVRVRLTGSVALSDEEFATVAEGTGIAALVALVLVVGLLFMAVRSWQLVACIVITLLAGIVATFAFAAATVGSLNLISIAFVVLFVGIAVDFGIQFSVRYRDRRYHGDEAAAALRGAAAASGKPLTLAAATTAGGFLALTPTDYIGVAELGLIAGAGMFIALALNLTLLPALLALARSPAERAPAGFSRAAALDRLLLVHRRKVLAAAVVLALVSLAAVPSLRFDFDPLALKDPRTESVSTLHDLMGSPTATPFTIDVLAISLAQADALAERLRALAEVDKVITASSFVPEAQDERLAAIDDLALLLGPMPAMQPAPPATPAQTSTALEAARQALSRVPADSVAAPAAGRLAAALAAIPHERPDVLAALQQALLAHLPTALEDLELALTAAAVDLQGLPPALLRDWLAADGRARLEVFPAGDTRDNAVVRRFAEAVSAVAPQATGAPVTVQASGRLVVDAFIEAGWIALLVISVLLALVLRRARDVLCVLAPLLLAGLLTALVCALLPLPLNFANIIALPLLLGIGVSFAIYFVVNWRAGEGSPLASPTARAVLFSGLTTAAAFGSLALSTHPGTASMGVLLTISLASTLLCTLLLLPALLGPPPETD